MEEKQHTATLENRGFLSLSGIVRVDSSNEERILLKTVLGDLVVEGEGLHIRHLDLEAGNLHLGGSINHLFYPAEPLRNKAKNKSGRLLGRVFK